MLAGATVHVQEVKILDGIKGGTVPARVSSGGAIHTHQTNSGTVTLGAVSTGDALEVWTNNAGTVTIGAVATGDALEVWPNQAGTVGALTPGTGATNLGKAEDAGHTTGDVGVMALGVRNDSVVQLAGTDLDYTPIAVDNAGRVFINPGNQAGALGKNEDAAHTSGDLGVMMLAVRKDTAAALAGTDGDYAPPEVNASGLWHTAMGSATTGRGQSLGGSAFELTASGTIVGATASMKIKVFAETLTVQGGTVNVRRRSGVAGGTIIGNQQFSPTGGIAWSNPVDSPLYETAAGSPLVLELTGAGTVGGVVRFFLEA